MPSVFDRFGFSSPAKANDGTSISEARGLLSSSSSLLSSAATPRVASPSASPDGAAALEKAPGFAAAIFIMATGCVAGFLPSAARGTATPAFLSTVRARGLLSLPLPFKRSGGARGGASARFPLAMPLSSVLAPSAAAAAPSWCKMPRARFACATGASSPSSRARPFNPGIVRSVGRPDETKGEGRDPAQSPDHNFSLRRVCVDRSRRPRQNASLGSPVPTRHNTKKSGFLPSAAYVSRESRRP